MKKGMTKLIALVLALMLTLSTGALAAETASDAYRVSGATERPEETQPEPGETEPGEAEPGEAVPSETEQPSAPAEEKEPVEVPETPVGKKQVCLNNASDSVKIFEAADSSSAVIGNAFHGDIVDVYVSDGGWTLIGMGGTKGWIASGHLRAVGAADARPETPAEPEPTEEPEATPEPVKPEAPAEPEEAGEPETEEVPSYNIGDEVEMTTDVDVRLGADGMTEIIETLPEGGKLTVLEVEGDWVKVEIDGQIGYVYIDDLPGLVLPEDPEAEEPELEEGELPPVKVTLFTSRRSVMAPGETVYLTSKIENLELYSESMMQWQVDKGDGYEDVPGATEDNYSFEASAETLAYDWQLLVYYR